MWLGSALMPPIAARRDTTQVSIAVQLVLQPGNAENQQQ
jgi:hypothetical protein